MDMLTRFLCGKYATGSTFSLNPPSTGIGEDSTDPRTGKYLTRMQLTYPRFITLLTYILLHLVAISRYLQKHLVLHSSPSNSHHVHSRIQH